MNKELWNLMVDFDLDHPRSEYGFSVRLAHENQWPAGFAEQAILEYKKFMYLAATSGAMVSPSEIVDIVWHQHLIFTKSYEAFCQLLGKKIEHIPSTHDRAEAEKFEIAREFTKEQYIANFGKQPKAFWEYHHLHQPLKLKKSIVNVRTFLWLGMIAMIAALFPAYSMLRNFYIGIDNPWFVLQYILLCAVAVFILRFINRETVLRHMERIDEDAFIFKLDPVELIYMKKERIDDLVHVSINQFIKEKKIKIEQNLKLTVAENFECKNTREFVIKDFIQLLIQVHYKVVVNRVKPKAIFQNTKQFVDKLRNHFMSSILYMKLMAINFAVYALIFIHGITRLLTGISRAKPVGILVFVLLLSIVAMVYFLWEVRNVFTKRAIPFFHKLRLEKSPEKHDTNEWKYFLHGQASLSAMLVPLIVYEPAVPGGNGGSSSSGCGSGCSGGSSCGGGGGCGGGGCGGCGS